MAGPVRNKMAPAKRAIITRLISFPVSKIIIYLMFVFACAQNVKEDCQNNHRDLEQGDIGRKKKVGPQMARALKIEPSAMPPSTNPITKGGLGQPNFFQEIS